MVGGMKFRGIIIILVMGMGCSSAVPPASEPRGDDGPQDDTLTDSVDTSIDEEADNELGDGATPDESLLEDNVACEQDTDDGESLTDEDEDAEGNTAAAELDDDEGELDDGGEDCGSFDIDSITWQERPPHPLDGLTQKQLLERMRDDMASLGPMSLGRIHGGALINAVQMPEGEDWIIRQPNAAWGTQEMVDAIGHCISKVRREIPDTPRLYIGHLSRKGGGRFPPHVSHQNGRDVDLGYYYRDQEAWYTPGSRDNFDLERNWALVKCFVTETDVELILSHSRLIAAMRDYAIEQGEDPHWVHQIMGGKTATLRAIVRHARGHGTHFHVRFYSPVARETARIMYPLLVRNKVIQPPRSFVHHRARKGHTLSYMARRYHTSQRAIRRANRMRNNLVREGKVYRIPRRSGVAKLDDIEPIRVPNRRLPPLPETEAESSSETGEIQGGVGTSNAKAAP